MRRRMKIPEAFRKAVVDYGSKEAVAPSVFGSNREGRCYVSTWTNWWLVERLYGQWKFAHALFTAKKPAKTWFYPWEKQNELDWKTTAMNVMNAEYSGNASYEWFEFEEDENGERHMYRVNQFDRIKNIKDPRLNNPALDYLFKYPEKTVAKAFREFKASLEKKN